MKIYLHILEKNQTHATNKTNMIWLVVLQFIDIYI